MTEYIGHKHIRRFQLEGVIDDDSDFFKLRHRLDQVLRDMMIEQGYLPRNDIDPSFSTERDGDSYKFLLTMHGVYIGKAKVKCYEAIVENRLIPKSTPKKKSEMP